MSDGRTSSHLSRQTVAGSVVRVKDLACSRAAGTRYTFGMPQLKAAFVDPQARSVVPSVPRTPRSGGGGRTLAVLACSSVLAALAGPAPARGEPKRSPPSAASVATAEPANAAAESTAATEVLATFDSSQITRADFEQVIAIKLPHERAGIAAEGGKQELLDAMIDYDLLVLEAERRGYGKHPGVLIATERAAAERMLIERMHVDPATIPKAQIDAVFAKERPLYSRPYLRRASQIQLATKEEAAALIKLLGSKKERERFAQLAVERSIDPGTRPQGGQLGYFARNGRSETDKPTDVALELVEETFKLKRVGDVSAQPVKRLDGSFSVVMLTGEMPAMQATLPQHEARIRYETSLQMQAEATDKLVKQLEAELKPEVHPELIGAIELPVGEPPDVPTGFRAAPPDPRAPLQPAPPDEF